MKASLDRYDGVSHTSETIYVDLSTEAGMKRFHEAMEQLKFIKRMADGEID